MERTENGDHGVRRDCILDYTTSVIYDITTLSTTCIVEQIICHDYSQWSGK